MIATTLADYGGVKVDARPVVNPEAELAADDLNRAHENLAQLTMGSSARAVVRWTCGAAATVDPADISVRGHWGNGDAAKPVITRAAQGRYTLTWAATYTDGLGYVEPVSLFAGHGQGSVGGIVADRAHVEVSSATGNVATVLIIDKNEALADVGAVSGNPIVATVWVY